MKKFLSLLLVAALALTLTFSFVACTEEAGNENGEVKADDIKVSGKGNTVMLIMIDSEYKDFISASSVTEAFKTICGGELDFEI